MFMKRLLKLSISAVVWAWDSFIRVFVKLGLMTARGSCVVLYYHGILERDKTRFAAQMDLLLRHAKPIPADNHQPLAAAGRYAAVTFDDGFVSVIQNALPALESRGIPATLFVPTGSLGRNPIWIRDPHVPASREIVLSPEQLKALAGNRVMAIGSHSVNHVNLLKLDPAKARAELADCKATLETILGTDIPLFSFPHGAHNERLIKEAKAIGYRRVFTISPTRAFTTADEFVTGRTLADPSDWDLEFVLKTLGAYRWMSAASALKRRIASNNLF
jgi:peptidoglycan/xylan/chitin deacetylase (PgdA/CDA1 family)